SQRYVVSRHNPQCSSEVLGLMRFDHEALGEGFLEGDGGWFFGAHRGLGAFLVLIASPECREAAPLTPGPSSAPIAPLERWVAAPPPRSPSRGEGGDRANKPRAPLLPLREK